MSSPLSFLPAAGTLEEMVGDGKAPRRKVPGSLHQCMANSYPGLHLTLCDQDTNSCGNLLRAQGLLILQCRLFHPEF